MKKYILLLLTALVTLTACENKVKSVTLLSDEISLKVGDVYQLAAYTTPLDADYDMTWSSSNSAVASVSESGLVVGISVGQCEITVEAGGKSALCSVSVTEGEVDIDSDVNITSYGAVNSWFSVGDFTVVQFSRGNLQYQPSSGTWRFADYQYASLGAENRNIAQSSDSWIDLFGWGTSGWNSGANAYFPWSNDQSDANYLVGGNASFGLSGDMSNADWGKFNPIQNGGNVAGLWRTLTKDEWIFLFDTNYLRKDKWALATINGFYKGVILLPDNWVRPDGIDYSHGAPLGYNTNKYTNQQWLKLQSSGAVFLPMSGLRDGSDVSAVNSDGYYWSSTPDGADAAHALWILAGTISPSASRNRHYGLSVRLVLEHQTD